MNPLDRILERETIQKALASNENEIFEGQLTNGDFKWLIEQAEKAEKMEKFARMYYRVFLDSRHINENMRISHNDQYFLYAEANYLLGEPNGKRLD